MKKKNANRKNELIPAGGSFLLYTTEDGKEKIEVRLENETVWMTQAAMAELFQTTTQNITIHLKGIYSEGELEEGATCKDNLQVQKLMRRWPSLKWCRISFILPFPERPRPNLLPSGRMLQKLIWD